MLKSAFGLYSILWMSLRSMSWKFLGKMFPKVEFPSRAVTGQDRGPGQTVMCPRRRTLGANQE